MSKFKIFLINFSLFIISIIGLFTFGLIGFITGVFNILFKGTSTEYFEDIAVVIDMLGNVLCKDPLNNYFIAKDSLHKFGKTGETISSVLGKNQRDQTLLRPGVFTANTLDKIEKEHCKKAINNKI